MAENGEEKLIAAVRHIAKTLGRTDTMADDILQIFSSFDGRFSLEKLADKRDDATGGGDEHLPPLTSIERTLRTLDRQISHFVSSDRLIWSDSADASAFLEAVDDLLATIHEVDSSPAPPAKKQLLDRADELLQRCMLRLEDEFRSLIEQPTSAAVAPPLDSDGDDTDAEEDDDDDDGDRIPIAKPVTDYDLVIESLPPGSISDLQSIASRMAAAGFGRECAETYAAARRSFIDESVARLGIRPRTAEEIQSTPWDNLEQDISRWIRAFVMVFRILIPSERRLCDRIFSDDLSPFSDLAFAAACRAPALHLLSFADAVAAASRAPERLFRVVDMYESVRDLLADLDPFFSDHVAAVHKALGASIRGIFMELENLIRRDPARGAVPGGGLHPITRYVMNYLRAACASRQTLEQVMEDDSSAVDPDRPSSSLAVQIAWIMDVLQTNLESKSKMYPDPSLSCIFLMNNGRYTIQKVRDSELGLLLGEEWIRRLMAKVRRWGGDYQRGTWGKVVAVLQTGSSGSGSVTGKIMRERLRMFNNYLEEISRVQAGWVAADPQLQTELRVSVLEMVLPAYRNFLARMRGMADSGRDKYLKYSPEEVEARIDELFEGMGKRSDKG
ncbi:exocyst complex component EXO70B1-like [Typha latifolia]|uniref:exocyst complex component EXO70B1-like n=1 Tax=Typha latifolia TaxID=4733 RepID=UPI003C2F8884